MEIHTYRGERFQEILYMFTLGIAERGGAPARRVPERSDSIDAVITITFQRRIFHVRGLPRHVLLHNSYGKRRCPSDRIERDADGT